MSTPSDDMPPEIWLVKLVDGDKVLIDRTMFDEIQALATGGVDEETGWLIEVKTVNKEGKATDKMLMVNVNQVVSIRPYEAPPGPYFTSISTRRR